MGSTVELYRTKEQYLADAQDGYNKDVERMLAWHGKQLAEKRARIEQHFEIFPLLAEIDGIEVSVWGHASYVNIRVGEQPRRGNLAKAVHEANVRVFTRKLTALRRILGRLHVEGRELEDLEKRTVEVTLKAIKFPGVVIKYSTVMPKPKKGEGKPKCRIVKRVSHDLVCDL